MKMLRFTSAGWSANLLFGSVFRWRAAVLARTFGVALGVGGYFLLSPAAFPQGSLTPPGAPTPTMKTLDQVEARIPIDATHTPGDANNEFIITQRGSYYLTGNLNVSKSTGISVTANGGVTVDLNGFQVARFIGSVGTGISATGLLSNYTIQNGSVSGFSTGIFGAPRGGRISFINVSFCSQAGIAVGEGWGVDHCNAHENTGNGIAVGNGCIVSQCTASNNGLRGITTTNGSTIVDCSAYGNQSLAGISTGTGCTVTHCTATANTSAGVFSAGILTGASCLVVSCTATSNLNTNGTPTTQTGAGIIVGTRCAVHGCSVSGNKGDGINAISDCIISDNAAAANGNGGDGAGIHVTSNSNRIEANNVTSNDRGIDVSAAGNVIVRNTAGHNTTNYSIVAGNHYGPIVDNTDETPANAPAATGNSAVGDFNTTHPWANIAY